MKIHISMNDALLEEVDRVAKENYLSRSGIISMACAQYIQSRAMATALSTAADALKRIADSGQMSAEDVAELEAFSKQAQFYKNML